MTEIGEPAAITTDRSDTPENCTLKVQVQERTSGEPVAGVKVELSGSASQSGTTSGEGEVVFAGLPPGSYQVKISQDEFEMNP
ncbi:MAG: carboxypeptidase-like regulatory domain-containing protein, partial [Planctomycetaceae bacterium]